MGLSSYQSFCLLMLGVPMRLVRLLELGDAPARCCDCCDSHSEDCSGDRSNVRFKVCPNGLSKSRSDNRSDGRSYLSNGCLSNSLSKVLSNGCSCERSCSRSWGHSCSRSWGRSCSRSWSRSWGRSWSCSCGCCKGRCTSISGRDITEGLDASMSSSSGPTAQSRVDRGEDSEHKKMDESLSPFISSGP